MDSYKPKSISLQHAFNSTFHQKYSFKDFLQFLNYFTFDYVDINTNILNAKYS